MTARPFYIFVVGGKYYLINVDDRLSIHLPKEEAETLKLIEDNGKISPRQELLLWKYDLISGSSPVKNKRDAIEIQSVTLLVTHACNFKCTYCYEFSNFSQPHSKPGKMTFDVAQRTVDWLIKKSGSRRQLSLGFFGGEPLMNFSLIKEVVAYANLRAQEARKSFSFSLTTNGSLLNDEIIAFLKTHSIKVTVSMDGNKEIQNTQRPMLNGKDSYDIVRPKAVKLLEEMPDTSCQATMCGDTALDTVKESLAALGFKRIGLTNVTPATSEDRKMTSGKVWNIDTAIDFLEKEAITLRNAIANRDADAIRNPFNYLCQRVGTFLTGEVKEHHCGAGKASVAVANSGDIYLCHRFSDLSDYRLGHIEDLHIDREPYLDKPVGSIDACSNCFSRYHCPGGCYHDNLNTTGSVFEPNSDLCEVSRHMTELSAAIAADLVEEDIAFLVSEKLVDADASRRTASQIGITTGSVVAEAGLSGLSYAIPAPWVVSE